MLTTLPRCPQSTQEVPADPQSFAVKMVVASQQVNWASCVMGSITVETDQMRKTAVIPNLAHVIVYKISRIIHALFEKQ